MQPIPQLELPHCEICHLEPTPQSFQPYYLTLIELMLLFLDYKLALITLAISYSFVNIHWFCPQCKRQIEVPKSPQGTNSNVIIRISNCIMVIPKTIIRVIAAVAVAYLAYLLIYQWSAAPTNKHQTGHSWSSIANDCGYQVYLDNSFKANSVYGWYVNQQKQWTLEGIYLRQQPIKGSLQKVMLKMNPSQYENEHTEDIVVIINTAESFAVGDLLEVSGRWIKRDPPHDLFKFQGSSISKKGEGNPGKVEVLQAVKQFIKNYQKDKPSGSLSTAQPQQAK